MLGWEGLDCGRLGKGEVLVTPSECTLPPQHNFQGLTIAELLCQEILLLSLML